MILTVIMVRTRERGRHDRVLVYGLIDWSRERFRGVTRGE